MTETETDSHNTPFDDETARSWLDGLMRTHGDRLARYFATRVQGEDIARELVIETFFRAWKSRHTYRGEARPTTWLWTIAQRSLAHHYKQKARHQAEIPLDVLPETVTDNSNHLASRSRHALRTCIAQLNERLQRTVELVWLLGYSYVEAAEMMEESADTVRMRLKRVRKPLQDCLIEHGIVSPY